MDWNYIGGKKWTLAKMMLKFAIYTVLYGVYRKLNAIISEISRNNGDNGIHAAEITFRAVM